MALFINNGKYPDVFKNKGTIIGPNQVSYRTDFLTEWINEQRKAHELLNNRLHDFEKHTRRQNNKHINQGRILEQRIEALLKNNVRQQTFENDVLLSIKKLNTKNSTIQTLLTNGRSLDMEFIAQMNRMNESSKEITQQLGNFDIINARLSKSMAAQDNFHGKLEQQITKLENTQIVLQARLDNQEGLMEKLVRQVDHIRSVIFERTHLLTEKIEKLNKLTTSYKAKRKTSSQRSIKLYKIDEEQKTKES